jgi:hypothetical protein
MPRYFFHTATSTECDDTDGLELSDDEAARLEATRTLGQIIELCPNQFCRDRSLTMTVTDEAGMTIFVLDLTVANSPATLSGGAVPVAESL